MNNKEKDLEKDNNCKLCDMYESPITLVEDEISMCSEDNIYRAVQECRIDVDKDELIKALKYDRRQYEKGYADALNQIKTDLIERLRTRQRKCLNLYDEYMDGEDWRQSLLLEEVIDMVMKF